MATFVTPKPGDPARNQIVANLKNRLAGLERMSSDWGCERGSDRYWDRLAYETALAALEAGETYGLPRLSFFTQKD